MLFSVLFTSPAPMRDSLGALKARRNAPERFQLSLAHMCGCVVFLHVPHVLGSFLHFFFSGDVPSVGPQALCKLGLASELSQRAQSPQQSSAKYARDAVLRAVLRGRDECAGLPYLLLRPSGPEKERT